MTPADVHVVPRTGVVAPDQPSAFTPLLLLAIAIVAWFGFQTVQLVGERQQFNAAQATIDVQAQTATKIRSSLDAVATATAKLAADGNPSALAIVEELRKRGVTINAASAPAAK